MRHCNQTVVAISGLNYSFFSCEYSLIVRRLDGFPIQYGQRSAASHSIWLGENKNTKPAPKPDDFV